MAADLESLGTLERRLQMSVPTAQLEREVDERLKKLARNAKMPGFRPGRVPMKIVEQTYGAQVRNEVTGDAVQKAFTDAVKQANLKVAGYPRIEPKKDAVPAGALEFSATFEVYPDFKVGDVAGASIERPQVALDDAAIDKTIEVLRKQRTTYARVERAAQDGDRLTVDFDGTIGGEPFQGGKAAGFAFLLGEGRMLPGFETATCGMCAGESKTFELTFPQDYQAKDVAGKTASFVVALKQVDEPRLPALDAQFAHSLGVADGDLGRMRVEVRQNVEREVSKRVDGRLKQQALDALLASTPLELPKALVAQETQELVQRAAADLQARGVKIEKLPLDPQVFDAAAKRRVALGLIIAELARAEKLQPKPAQVRALIEREAASYESPAEVVKWIYMQPQRLSEMEGLALESNVVNWVLSKAKVADKALPFDELMGSKA